MQDLTCTNYNEFFDGSTFSQNGIYPKNMAQQLNHDKKIIRIYLMVLSLIIICAILINTFYLGPSESKNDNSNNDEDSDMNESVESDTSEPVYETMINSHYHNQNKEDDNGCQYFDLILYSPNNISVPSRMDSYIYFLNKQTQNIKIDVIEIKIKINKRNNMIIIDENKINKDTSNSQYIISKNDDILIVSLPKINNNIKNIFIDIPIIVLDVSYSNSRIKNDFEMKIDDVAIIYSKDSEELNHSKKITETCNSKIQTNKVFIHKKESNALNTQVSYDNNNKFSTKRKLLSDDVDSAQDNSGSNQIASIIAFALSIAFTCCFCIIFIYTNL
jgi:hypothetical protein